ncbi:Haloacid dehalogenase-like hydrolase (HAD) superfamily protein [Zea mays]|uniref:Haloacid dehalogenase-like hydrolase (HAD) superfamily protein n=1 Tax=Zea mays TaxID=4577 RepID=A0A1D6FZQ3_MAIZE|nr:Haloacid dehalogenase-like hydrolase (HAD) superfamily protein [Zea mays]
MIPSPLPPNVRGRMWSSSQTSTRGVVEMGRVEARRGGGGDEDASGHHAAATDARSGGAATRGGHRKCQEHEREWCMSAREAATVPRAGCCDGGCC